MLDVGDSLQGPLLAAERRLSGAASATALNAGGNQIRMADAAQEAIFTEVLMNALHSRLAEIKSVTK